MSYLNELIEGDLVVTIFVDIIHDFVEGLFIKVIIIDSNKGFGHLLSIKSIRLVFINLVEEVSDDGFMFFLQITIIVLSY
jgi:hypothetical protein